MANGYSSGKVYGYSSSTTATLQYRRSSDQLLVRTLYLTKSVGQAYWTYLTAIEALNHYDVTATDTTAGSGNPTQTKDVIVNAGQNTVTDFDIDPSSRAAGGPTAKVASITIDQPGVPDGTDVVVRVLVTHDQGIGSPVTWGYDLTDASEVGYDDATKTGTRRFELTGWIPKPSGKVKVQVASYEIAPGWAAANTLPATVTCNKKCETSVPNHDLHSHAGPIALPAWPTPSQPRAQKRGKA